MDIIIHLRWIRSILIINILYHDLACFFAIFLYFCIMIEFELDNKILYFEECSAFMYEKKVYSSQQNEMNPPYYYVPFNYLPIDLLKRLK